MELSKAGTITLLKKMAQIADELESDGHEKTAMAISQTMLKIAQEFKHPANQPLDAVTSNTGTAFLNQSFNNSVSATEKFISGLQQIASGGLDAGIAMTQQQLGMITLPVQALSAVGSLGVKSITDPMVNEINRLNQINTKQYNTIVQMLKAGKTEEAKSLAAQLVPYAQNQLSKTQNLKNMLVQRINAGQFKNTNELFQRYLDFAGKNKMTLNQIYSHAIKNNSQNFANNLAAVAKALGISDPNQVIPVGLKIK